MEQGCACAQGQRTCTARRAGAGVDKGLSAIPLRCHPERSDTLKGTRGSRAPGKTLTFTDGPLHLRTGFFVACAPQNDRKRAALCGITPCMRVRTVGIPSASACQTGASPRLSRLSAGDASLPTRRGALWNHALHACADGRHSLRLGMPNRRFAPFVTPLCGRCLPAHAARRFMESRLARLAAGSISSSPRYAETCAVHMSVTARCADISPARRRGAL